MRLWTAPAPVAEADTADTTPYHSGPGLNHGIPEEFRLFGGNGGTDSAPVTGLAWRDRVGVPPDDSRAGRRLERHAALGSGAGRPSARKRFVPSTVRTGLAIMNRSLRRRYS